MTYRPTARPGSRRLQHHGGFGFGQVTISSETVVPIDTDATIARLAQPTTSSATPTTTAYLSSGTKSTSSSLPSVTPQKDVTASFAQSTMPGWFEASQVATARSSNAPMYIAIGGAVVLFGIIIVASRRPLAAKPAANPRRRRRRRS